MNHIYKVVWSKVKNCYVVVAEIARSNGKPHSQKVVAVLGTALISSMLFTGGGQFEIAEAAEAGTAIISGGVYYEDGTNLHIAGSVAGDAVNNKGNAIALGSKTQATGANSVALGEQNKATGDNAIAFGGGYGKDAKSNTASGTASVAFGEGSQAISEGSVAFGYNTQAGNIEIDPKTQKPIIGGQNAVAFGNGTKALGGRSLAFGQSTIADYTNSVAFGNESQALSNGATAFGNRTHALATYGTAFGNRSIAAGNYAVAFGTDTLAGVKADESGAMTLQGGTKIDAYGNVAYTDSDTAKTTYAVRNFTRVDSQGNPTGETHDYVVVLGTDGKAYIQDYRGKIHEVTFSKDASGKTIATASTVDVTTTLQKAVHTSSAGYDFIDFDNATAFGRETKATNEEATAFGRNTEASGITSTAFGESSTASGEAATAFGISSTASGKNSLAALGGTASAENAAAIGNGAQAKLADSVALGSGAVADRQSGTKGYDMLKKGETTNTSAVWVANANAIAIGNGSTLTRQITGVAAGSQDTDAVNVAQLKAAGFKVTTQKDDAKSSSILNGDTLDFEAKDNAIVSTTKDSKTITVSVSKTPTFDSATFYNPTGSDNEKVTIANGHISTYNKDQRERAVLGTDNQGNGTLHLVNNDLSQVHLYTQKANDDNGVNDGVTRMWYTASSDGEGTGIHTIAVLDDGINYVGDNYTDDKKTNKVVVKHKLNSTMDITGGADTSNLSNNNIGVVATPAVEDEQGNITQKGKLEIKLNKDLQDLNSVTAGNVRIGNNPANTLQLTEKGQVTENTAPAGNYVTGLDNKAWDTKNPSYVSGRAATEDQLAKVSGVVDKGLSFTTNTKDATNTTGNYTGYKVVNRQLGDTISIKAGDADPNMKYETKNLTSQIAENGDITISMADKPTFSEVTASSFNLSPKDTTTKDQAGNTASAQLNAHYRDASLNPKKNVTMADGSTGMVRLHYHDGEGTIHDLATMDDGQIYAGDIKADGTADSIGFARTMNQRTTINGGVREQDNLTDNNIGVVSNGTDTLTVKLAKNLKNLKSVQAGKTTIDDNGLTIKKSDDDSGKNILVLGDKVAFGDTQVNRMGSGSDDTDADGNPTYNTLTNGANIGDVKNIASSTVQPVIDTVNKGWELDVNGTKQKAVTPDSPKVNLIQGQNITITGDTTNTDNVTIATADDVRFNTVRVGGVKSGDTYSGGILIGTQSGKNTDGTESANSNDDYYITGLKNTNWDSTKIQHGRAATEDQLQAVATEIKNGTVKGDVYVTGGAVFYKGEGEGADPKDKDGTGSINLTRQNGTDVHIDGLHDYYVTGGMVTNDGKKLELTRNDIDDSGNPKKITVDLGNVLKNDLHLVANPAADSNGKYKVDTTTGTVTLKVQNADGTTSNDITIGGFEGLGQGLKFGANKMAKDGGGNPVTNQLGSTINITGAGTKGLTDYSGKNLLTSVEQNTDGNTIVHVLMDKNISADGVTVGQAGKDGVAGADGEIGQAGTIGINGKNGVKGEDGKQGITTTIIRTEKGQAGKDGEIGQQGAPGVDGKDITRIVYQNDQDKVDGKDGSHTVATLDDGLKFSGDDNKIINKKLNEQMQFVGGADKDKLTQNNIGINELDDGKLTIQLVNTPDLGDKGNLKAGDAQIGWFNGDTLVMTKDGTNPSGNKAGAGSYATGLSNKDWNTDSPEYVSGRAATEDQLAKVSEAVNNLNTATSKRTVVTVNDKSNPATAKPKAGDYGDYDSTNGNLMIAAKDENGKTTYNIKLNDQLAIGQKGENGKDGKVTVETKGGTTVVIGHDGKDGELGRDGLFVTSKDGKDAVSISSKDGAGHIGLTGPKGADGKDGAFTDLSTILGTATLAPAKNEQSKAKDTVSADDKSSRIQYQTTVTDKDGNTKTVITHEVATMDDGLKFAGDDVNTTVAKKLNDTLQIRGDGTYNAATKKSDGNIQTSVEGGTIKVALNKDINLKQDGSLTIGGDKQDDSTESKDPIVIKHFDDKTLDMITGVGEDGKPIIAKEGKAGDYVTGLDNKDWNVTNPTYISGRAATEDQLKTISDAVNKAASTAGMHTVVTVNDKDSSETTASVGTNGNYGAYSDSDKGNLLIASKDENGKTTYNIKLNDQLAIGQKGEPGVAGKDGKDGKVTVETKGGTTVVIGHDGKDGEPGSDGFFVTGKDGKSGVSITGPNGAAGKDGVDGKVGIAGKDGRDAVSIAGRDGVGHIGLTGPKGEKGAGGMPGKDGISIDITTDLKSATLDDGKNVKTVIKDKDGKETTITQAPRIQYDSNGKSYEVATMDDGLKFVGNDGKEVTKKLNSTMSLTGGMDKDAVAKASSKNLGVRSNAKGDGLELVMTDTPDFTKVTVGEGTDTTQKIIIGKQTVTGKKSDGIAGTAETGKYITGLDNTKWNKDNVVENRAATEGQLRDIAGSITNQTQGGGFGLADEAGNTVKKDLGQTVTVKGDGKNIETKVVNGSLEVSLKKDVDLGGNGSINAGQTKVDQNGVDTNKVTIKDSGISISKDGINGGGKQITNIASGIDGKTYADAQDNNAASIGDVKNIAGKVEQNVTNVTEKVNQIGQHVDKIQTDVTQLQQDVKADRQYQGDDAATKKSVNVKFGRFLSLTGGAKIDALADEGNLGVIQQEREDPDHKGEKLTGLSIRLAKDLKGLNSVEANTVNAKTVNSETFQAGNTTINNGGLTVKGDDKHKDITVQQGSVNMGGNKIEGVAPGKVAPDSTEAVNGSQLAQRDQAIGKLGGEVSSLDRRVDRVGAGAAALAALHPQDFDPDDKWDFAVGYGNYRGANAAAVGAFYRPNEDTTLSVGGTVGGGENMVNAGISFKFGQGNHVTNSRVAMAKELLALKDYVQKQDEKIEKLEALVGQQGTAAAPKRRSILFPDVPENHWAYAYVKKLADRGLLEGYPDGEFKGDRTITRYEFAAIFSRALENGASVDGDMERMSEEFEPEIRELSLNRFRVDRVEGKDNDRHKIERVRVNDRDELVKQKNGEQKKRYRDLYGSVIEKDTPADAAK